MHPWLMRMPFRRQHGAKQKRISAFMRPVVVVGLAALLVLANHSRPGQTRPAPDELGTYLFAVSVQGEDSTNEVYRYLVTPNGAPILDFVITDPNLDRPYGLAFSPWGELFVANRGNPWHGGGNGSVVRFLNPRGVPVPNGTIQSYYFQCPHGAGFRGNELFIAQRFGSNVLRFSVKASGQASLSGMIVDNLCCTAPRSVALGPDQSTLFVSECCTVHHIDYYALTSGNGAILLGVIEDVRLVNPSSLAFSPWGELFVTNTDGQNVLRYLLDQDGQWQPNGELTGNGLDGPIGLDFSPWGELFVSNLYGSGGISRWTFDPDHSPIPHGYFSSPTTLGEIRFYPTFRTYLPRTGGLPPAPGRP